MEILVVGSSRRVAFICVVAALCGCADVAGSDDAPAPCKADAISSNQDASTDVSDASLDVRDGARDVATDATDGAVAGDVRDAAEADDEAEVDPDDPAHCVGNETARPDPAYANLDCDVVVRLDYATRAPLGYRLICDDRYFEGALTPLDAPHARLAARGALGLDGDFETVVTGADGDIAFLHASTGADDLGAFAIVDTRLARAVASGTTSAAGGALTEQTWNPPWDTTRCFAEYELLGVTAFAADGVLIDDALATEIAHDAWHGPIGAYWEEYGGCAANAYRASVVRWADVTGGAYREWLVVIHVGAGCPDD